MNYKNHYRTTLGVYNKRSIANKKMRVQILEELDKRDSFFYDPNSPALGVGYSSSK